MLLVAIFAVGYLAIVFEHQIGLNKAAPALLTGVLCWTVYMLGHDTELVNEHLGHHLADLSQILFFLLGAMTIVELIDAHDGFEIITSRITTSSRRKLLVIIGILSFFLSAALDNLTTSIVMMSLVRKLMSDDTDRRFYGGVVIIAANSGGAWSPIGDVTTTMLWIGGQITTPNIILHVIVPSLVSLIIPLLWIGWRMKGSVERTPQQQTSMRQLTGVEAGLPELPSHTPVTLPADAVAVGRRVGELRVRKRTGVSVESIQSDDGTIMAADHKLCVGDTLVLSGPPAAIPHALALLITGRAPEPTQPWERKLVFAVGTGMLIFVPIFKTLTHLPPYMGILFGVGVLWSLTEFLHKDKNDEHKGQLSVAGALQRVDTQSVLFFLGILLAITALQSAGLLAALAGEMDRVIGNVNIITMAIGLSSSIVDNVPLVAAAQGMYSLTTFPVDHHFWLFLAYCAGTGGSILIIGSAAGIAVMGIQRITFGWYIRHMSLPALAGYAAGALTYVLAAAA